MKGSYVPRVIQQKDLRMLEKSGGGQRVGFGEKMALLVVDMTNAFVDDRYSTGSGGTGKAAVKAIRRLLDKARGLGIPVFYTTDRYSAPFPYKEVERGRWKDKFKPTSPGGGPEANEIVDEIKPNEEDVVLSKSKPSAFFGTQLESMLNYLRIDTLIVTGMITSGCIRATVVDAFSYNYRVIIPIECVADGIEISHQVNLFDMDMKYADVMPLSDVLGRLEEHGREKRKC